MPKNSGHRIIIVSDGTGETAVQMTEAAMVQFIQHDVHFTRYKNVRNEAQIEAICEDAAVHKDLLIYTLVSPQLRAFLTRKAREVSIPCVDLLGPLLVGLASHFGYEPKSIAGLLHDVNERYFERIEAMEYTIAHDDGRDLTQLESADLIILGISRTSKTPLSMYLSHQGWKVANVPLIRDFEIPKEIFNVDQKRVIGLTIDPEDLATIRRARLERLGQDKGGDYADPDKVNQEIEYANEIFRMNRRWPVFNVTGKALEETASEIIKLMASRRLTPSHSLETLPQKEDPDTMTSTMPSTKNRRGSQVWYNGKILPAEEARISLFTHALHYGTGAFEGIRAYRQKSGGGAVFKLEEHMQRLIESCKILNLTLPFPRAELVRAALEVCRANSFEECYIRPIAYIGDGPLGVYPGDKPQVDLAILAWEWGSYLGDKGINEGARLMVSSFIRPHVNSSMTKGKITGQYVNSVLAKREALALGYDEALLLDPEGYLTEGSGENLFLIKNGVVKTTPLNSILNGITRQTAINYLRHLGHSVIESRFTRDELWCADEVFLTGTAAEVTPIREIDGRLIGEGKPGPIAARLQRDYQSIVRGELTEDFTHGWLTQI